MYRRNRYSGSDLIIHGLAAPPFGPGFPPALLADADVLECWVSDLGDPADQTEWRLWRNSRLIGRKVMLGY
jgi:hypothetical protein